MRTLTLARDLKRRKARERSGLFVAEGVRGIEELLRSPIEIVGLLAAPKLIDSSRGRELVENARLRGCEVAEVDEREFRSAAETESPQGVLALARIPSWSIDAVLTKTPLRILVLDQVQDPGNVGTLLRTAAALGVHATIALPGTVDVWNAKVVRSAMGAHFHHPAMHSSWGDLKATLERGDVELWAADPRGTPWSGAAPDRLALAVGNEGAGLTSDVRAAAIRAVSLAASGADSLNVAVAAGILLYELRP